MLLVIGVRAGGEGQGKGDPVAALRSQWGELFYVCHFLTTEIIQNADYCPEKRGAQKPLLD